MAVYQTLLNYFKAFVDIRTVLIGLVLFLILSWVAQRFLHQINNLPPGPRGWPLLGCVPQLMLKSVPIHELLQLLYRTYGPVCHLPLPFGKRAFIISGYRAVHGSLTCSEFNWRPPFPKDCFHELLNASGVIMASGDLWKEHRKFSLTVLRGFGVGKRSFENQIATESECMMKDIGANEGDPFDPTHLFCNAVSNVICSVVLGKRFEYGDPEFKHLLYLLDDSLNHPGVGILIDTLPFLAKIPFFPKAGIPSMILLRQKLKDVVDEHRETFDEENLQDFIDVYINDIRVKKEQNIQTHFSDLELVAVVHHLFLAGTETTSTTLRWALLCMLKFPDEQRKVHEEIDTVVGRDRLPKLSDKPNLPYTDAVIHEVQRFASIVNIAPPRYTYQDTEFQGFKIPKGSYILANFYSVTRDSSIWENPDVFTPDRFLDDNGQVKKIPEDIVFGAGKRVCLGEQLARMELFIFFTHLMHQFSFKKPTDTESVNIRPKSGSVLQPFPYNICAISRTSGGLRL